MEKIIVTWFSKDLDIRTPLLVASIRKFAGSLSDCPIWVFFSGQENDISNRMKQQLNSLNVHIKSVLFDSDLREFPFAEFVYTAAKIESLATKKAELLAWLTPDTLIINEPTDFLLDSKKNLAYRPVHHTLIGSHFEKPIDPFWKLIYRKCQVPNDHIFPMKTHVDGHILRPYFNAGCLITRPKQEILQTWWNRFSELYTQTEFRRFYKKNQLFAIFIHQAVLTGIILSALKPHELQELPFTYNYPIHLYSESSKEFRPKNINELITMRYEQLEWLNKVPIDDPLKNWLIDKISTLSNV